MSAVLSTDQPEVLLDHKLNEFAASGAREWVLALRYGYKQVYLPEAPEVNLVALVGFKRTGEEAAASVDLGVAILEETASLSRQLAELPTDVAGMASLARRHGSPWLWLDGPLTLDPVHIPKPWGQEIWYSGIEARGQSGVTDGEGSVPLPWLLSLCPRRLLNSEAVQPVLLKILDPLPEPVFGDLYFEMHEEKREVYVVTHVDPSAWPGGEGGIRFGFDQARRSSFADDAAFKAAYLEAVQAYRQVRESIDRHLDECRRAAGIPLDQPVAAETTQQWLGSVPEDLHEREVQLRKAMESFIHTEPLVVGDVIQMPTYTPHSLLHGVRTIEFQTPVYERKILSFAQKVLTQGHWDTESALRGINLDSPARPLLPVRYRTDDVTVEAVVEFADFEVDRITLNPGAAYQIDIGEDYRLAMAVTPGTELQGQPLDAEQACLLPAKLTEVTINNTSQQNAIVLLAKPLFSSPTD